MGAQVINVDFKRRTVISGPAIESVERETEPKDMFEEFDHTIECMEARFGENQPEGGVISPIPKTGMIFDTYGRGNAHDSIHQYRPGPNVKWNRPMPFPVDLREIDKFLKARSGKVVKLGSKSDPFMWMDHKYEITKNTLRLANQYGVQLFIETMSDLCAHDDYLELLKAGKHTISMHLGFEEYFESERAYPSKSVERQVSPGAPSVQRRLKALAKLRDSGVEAVERFSSTANLNKTQKQRFFKQTGIWLDGIK